MKLVIHKLGVILTIAALLAFSANVSGQDKISKNNIDKYQELKSERAVESISTFKHLNKRYTINELETNSPQNFSAQKTYPSNQKQFTPQSILADPSDSAYVYDWVTDEWVLDTRLLYYFNASGYEIIEEKKDEGANEWSKQFRTELLFYESNTVQKETSSFWKESTKEWITDELSEYNTAGERTQYYVKAWNDTTQKFNAGIRIVSTFENDTNLVEDLLQEWDSILNTWASVLMVENTFNSSGLVTSSTEKIFDKESSTWENSYYMMYEYDLGELTGETWQYWDTISSQWANDLKVARTYNEIGDLTEQLVQVWDTDDSDWLNNNKRMVGYNDFFQLETVSNQIWNTDTDAWDDTTKATYSYSDLGDLLNYLEEAWNGSAWENVYQESRKYDSGNNLTEINLEEWSTDDNEWMKYANIYYTYDLNDGYIKSRQDDYWNPNTSSWETEFYAELGIVANALDFLEYYDKDWNDTLYEFTGGFRELYQYYANGQSKEIIVQEWDTVNSSWVNDQKILYYWEDGIASSPETEFEQISIYPTPFNNILNIELTENINSAEIVLYNIQGQKIEEFYIDKKVTSIELSRLKNGVYFIVYEADNRKFVKKIVKQ